MSGKEIFDFLSDNYDNIDKNKMPLIVRTDVINPLTYFFIEFKYKNILEFIYGCGGYCFFEQFNLMIGNRKSGWEAIKHLEELNVIGTEYLNNNKYVYLKYSALIYFKFKNNFEILIDGSTTVNDRSNLTSKPADSILKRSAAILEYNLKYIFDSIDSEKFDKKQRYEVFLSRNMCNYFIDCFYRLFDEFNLDETIQKYKFLYDRSGIYLACIMCDGSYIDEQDLIFDKEKILFHFVIFDYGDLDIKGLNNSLIKISRFMECFGYKNMFMNSISNIDGTIKDIRLNNFKFFIEVCTFNSNRESYLKSEIYSLINNINVKNKYIIDCQSNSKLLRYNSQEELYLKRESLKNQYISGFEKIIINSKIENVENLFKRSSQKVKTFLKKKDIDRFEALRNYLMKEE